MTIITLLLGLFFGFFARHGITIIVILAVIVAVSLVAGVATPALITNMFELASANVQSAVGMFTQLAPYESVFFFVGFGIGFWRGK